MDLSPDRDLELPAIVIGHRCEERQLSDVNAYGVPWLASFTHQCGGHACLQQSVVGLLLPLAWNGLGEMATHVVHGLDALASDSPSTARQQELPDELVGLHLTCGQSYHRGQLDSLEAFVSQAFTFPAVVSGVEAFVELADCSPIKTFEGWRALSFDAKRPPFYERRSGDWPFALTLARQRWDGTTVIEEALLEELTRCLEESGFEPTLRVFLLWENSD